MSYNQVINDIFIDTIDENIIRKNINIPENLLEHYLGKNGSNIKNLQHYANVKITSDDSIITDEKGIKNKNIIITGGIESVNIAYNVINKLAKSITKHIYIDKSLTPARLIGPKMKHKRLIETSYGASTAY